jgi:hypothetical protein
MLTCLESVSNHLAKLVQVLDIWVAATYLEVVVFSHASEHNVEG